MVTHRSSHCHSSSHRLLFFSHARNIIPGRYRYTRSPLYTPLEANRPNTETKTNKYLRHAGRLISIIEREGFQGYIYVGCMSFDPWLYRNHDPARFRLSSLAHSGWFWLFGSVFIIQIDFNHHYCTECVEQRLPVWFHFRFFLPTNEFTSFPRGPGWRDLTDSRLNYAWSSHLWREASSACLKQCRILLERSAAALQTGSTHSALYIRLWRIKSGLRLTTSMQDILNEQSNVHSFASGIENHRRCGPGAMIRSLWKVIHRLGNLEFLDCLT